MEHFSAEELERRANEILAGDEIGKGILGELGDGNYLGTAVEQRVLDHNSNLGEGRIVYIATGSEYFLEGIEAEPQGAGIFPLMMSDLEEIAIEEGIKGFELDVSTDNLHAQRAYRAAGFCSCGDSCREEGCITMRKDLLYGK